MGELEERINSVLNDPGQLAEITKLAQSIMGGGQESQKENVDSSVSAGLMGQLGLDGETVSRIGRLLGNAGGEKSRSQALLEAMKPYLSDKRRDKMDKALKLARLAKLAGLAAGEMGGGNDK